MADNAASPAREQQLKAKLGKVALQLHQKAARAQPPDVEKGGAPAVGKGAKGASVRRPKKKQRIVQESRLEQLAECCCGDESPWRKVSPCCCWLSWLFVLLALLGLGLGLSLTGAVGQEAYACVLAFLPFYVAGLVALPCYAFCVAANYTDDDDWGFGFGDYDEGPGNIACMMTTCALCMTFCAGAGGSVAAIVASVGPNATYIVT